MKVVIIEDEYPAAERLEKLIKKLDPKIEIIAVLESVESAKRWFAGAHQVDLIFSDIQLSDGLSFQIFEAFPAHSPIVFTTSYDEYAIKAFRVKSIDYLLKPIKLPELADAIKKFDGLKEDFSPKSYARKVESLLDSLEMSKKAHKTRFLVKNGEQLIPIHQDQVAYFYTANELACLVGTDGRQYLVDYKLEELETLVDPASFFRLNRQFIASVSAIQKIHTYFNGKLKIQLRPETAQEVIVSREKAPAFKSWLEN
ncbi:LytR/AlgR family response regulator transcription factor [Dyadobacter psychrophilus]|uniref:Two component transcriptional regulator, LytTR family n=1 Tax=Dyadobacter psychrophilus TaxID=651661 RepID=A0A1T5EF36_9BACT|nr:LytTR family DNA-binding domain-containing protein [Dyadobacter psychrophilus]SKB82541.1 two component transcriptional regulator, LytTR family [Dyadobacter psychrophilus]